MQISTDKQYPSACFDGMGESVSDGTVSSELVVLSADQPRQLSGRADSPRELFTNFSFHAARSAPFVAKTVWALPIAPLAASCSLTSSASAHAERNAHGDGMEECGLMMVDAHFDARARDMKQRSTRRVDDST